MENVRALLFSLLCVSQLSCSGRSALSIDQGSMRASDFKGYILVSTVATDPATGPGIATLFTPNGVMSKIVHDYYGAGEWPTGTGFVPPDKMILAIEGADRLDVFDLISNALTPVVNVNLTATPLRHVAVSPVDRSIYVVEGSTNTVEKFTVGGDGLYTRGALIATTTGSCVLATPWGATVIPSTNQLAVISSAASGRLSIYNSDGSCATHVTAPPFNANTPLAIAYHALSNKLLVTFVTNHAIYAVDLNGGNPVEIFRNSSVISTPRAIAADADGYIYVGSSGTDTVEKLYYNGTGVATRAIPGPLIGPGLSTQNPTSITVIP